MWTTVWNLIDKHGFAIVVAMMVIGVFIWIVRTLITHMLAQANSATKERKELTDRFLLTMERQAVESTRAIQQMIDSFQSFQSRIVDWAKDSSDEHKEARAVLGDVQTRVVNVEKKVRTKSGRGDGKSVGAGRR
jgi:Na+/phosphate symporter